MASESAPPEQLAALSFRAYYDEHLPYVWQSLRRLGMAERDLPDLAQEVFLAAYRRSEGFDPARPVRPWLFGIAFRVASDFRRTARNAREIPTERLEPEPAAGGPEEHVEQQQRRLLIKRALDELTLERRAVFVMHELHDHSIPEIADALSIPLNTAYSRLRLAREDFRDAVRRLELSKGGSP